MICWPTVPFRDPTDLAQHFEDHRYGFVGLTTVADYLARAEAFLYGPVRATALECPRPQGGYARYDTMTEEYGSVRVDGTIATYFIPDPAIHGLISNLAYFHRHCQ